jgi:hypothetical protein
MHIQVLHYSMLILQYLVDCKFFKGKRGGAAGPALLLAHVIDWVALSGKWSSAGVI